MSQRHYEVRSLRTRIVDYSQLYLASGLGDEYLKQWPKLRNDHPHGLVECAHHRKTLSKCAGCQFLLCLLPEPLSPLLPTPHLGTTLSTAFFFTVPKPCRAYIHPPSNPNSLRMTSRSAFTSPESTLPAVYRAFPPSPLSSINTSVSKGGTTKQGEQSQVMRSERQRREGVTWSLVSTEGHWLLF